MSKKENKEATGTEVAKKGQFDIDNLTREDVPGMLELIKKKISELKGKRPNEEKTEGKTLSGFGKISEIKDVSSLVKAYSMLTKKEEAYKEAAKALSVDVSKYPFKENGVGAAAWKNDIEMRMVDVIHEAELTRLTKVKSILEENLSQEQKFANDMKKIFSEFAE